MSTVRAIADGEILLEATVDNPEDDYEELKYVTWLMRQDFPERTNIVVQLIVEDRVEAENHVNPAPAH